MKQITVGLAVPDSCTYARAASLIKSAFDVSDSTLFDLVEYQPLTFPALDKQCDALRADLKLWQETAREIARARDQYKSEFHAAQAALTNALRERDHAREVARVSLATEAHAQAFDDMQVLRARAKGYADTRAALAAAYGECSGEEWKRLCLANQAAMLSLTVLREKLGV